MRERHNKKAQTKLTHDEMLKTLPNVDFTDKLAFRMLLKKLIDDGSLKYQCF